MSDEPSAEERMTDREILVGAARRFEQLYEAFRRALGHSIVALILAFGFAKIAYVEALAMIRESRGFFRAGTEHCRAAAEAGAKFLLGKSVSPR